MSEIELPISLNELEIPKIEVALVISLIQFLMFPIQFLISVIHLVISAILFLISLIRFLIFVNHLVISANQRYHGELN